MPTAQPTAEIELKVLIDAVLVQARQTRQRRMLVISGDAGWCRVVAAHTVAHSKLSRVSWLSTIELQAADVLPMSAAKTLLGQERDAIIFDVHAGFDADAFGAVSGVICGGGLLILLCPPLPQWAHFADPAAQRIAVWPHSVADVSGRFLRRIARIISVSPTILRIEQGFALPVLSAPPKLLSPKKVTDDIFRTENQRAAVAAIEQVARGKTHCPLVLVADRGRGKTAALGIAAARLLRTHGLHIVVTAPRPAAVRPLFAQAQRLLPEATLGNNRVQWGEGCIQFVAPDVLCLSELPADLLLVDEAAAIPATLLQQMLERYARIVFSTTTHGYEGTGRGFAVRFKQTLDTQTPDWREMNLHTPIRWAEHDPLERLVFDALLLDAANADDEVVAQATVDSVVVERLSRDALLNEEEMLSQLFGLLVVAHYRTSPNDLRNLLDGPGLAVYVSRYAGQVVATALVSTEGGFDAEMTEEIYAGRRRPRGHLIPQSLTTHAGLKAAAALRCARVMRIAVHPALQGKGLGRQLLRHIKNAAQKQGADLFGASFGGTASLLHFWAQENVLPVRLGFKRGHASGEYSLMVLCALSAAGESVYAAARARFVRDLPHWLADPLQGLDAALSASLLPATEAGEVGLPKHHDQEMLHSFARGERNYEDALAPMWRLLMAVKEQTVPAPAIVEYNLLIAKVIKKQTWAAVADKFSLTGKAEVLACLRKAVSQLLIASETGF